MVSFSTRHTFMLSGCRLLLTTRMSAFTIAVSAASVAARVGYAAAPVARTKPAGRFDAHSRHIAVTPVCLSLIHISEPTRQEAISYAVFCSSMAVSYTHLTLPTILLV